MANMKSIFVLFILPLTIAAKGQTILLQEDFSSGIPSGWQVIDQDNFMPDSSLMNTFTDGWIWYTDSPDTSIATTSFFEDTTGNAEDYIILPKLSLLTHSKISWDAKSQDASYPDGYLVLLSTTDSAISSFTDTLLQVDAEYFQWERSSIELDTMGYNNQDVYIAFCHHTAAGYILELDNILVETSDFTTIPTEEHYSESVNLYPNPSKDVITIATDGYSFVTIHQLNGAMVMYSDEKLIDISSLPAGKYYVIIRTDEGTHSKGFVKQ